MAYLEVKDLDVHYGAIHALRGVSFQLNEGEMAAFVGANGAGKSTLLRAISGEVPITRGSVIFQGESLVGLRPSSIARKGIIQCPEGRRIFAGLTVLENLELGAWGVGMTAFVKESLQYVYTLFPRLAERSRQLAGTLSGGEQQMLAIGRALMARPRLLLLDEPCLGLAPKLIETVFDAVHRINSQGTTVILVEQNAFSALQLAKYGYVLETGNVVLAGDTRQLLRDRQLLRAYLG